MKMMTLRTTIAVLAFAVLSLSTSGRAQSDGLSRATAADPIAIPMTADRWETKENAEFLRQLGFFDDMPGSSAEWQPLSTERNGLVNISRVYGHRTTASENCRFGQLRAERRRTGSATASETSCERRFGSFTVEQPS